MWKLFVGKGRLVEDIAPGEVSRVAKALGALGDWRGIVRLLESKKVEGGGRLPALNGFRCEHCRAELPALALHWG